MFISNCQFNTATVCHKPFKILTQKPNQSFDERFWGLHSFNPNEFPIASPNYQTQVHNEIFGKFEKKTINKILWNSMILFILCKSLGHF